MSVFERVWCVGVLACASNAHVLATLHEAAPHTMEYESLCHRRGGRIEWNNTNTLSYSVPANDEDCRRKSFPHQPNSENDDIPPTLLRHQNLFRDVWGGETKVLRKTYLALFFLSFILK